MTQPTASALVDEIERQIKAGAAVDAPTYRRITLSVVAWEAILADLRRIAQAPVLVGEDRQHAVELGQQCSLIVDSPDGRQGGPSVESFGTHPDLIRRVAEARKDAARRSAQAPVPSVEDIARAREIIAEGCGCHRDCGTSDGEVVTCGCEREARAIFSIRAERQPGNDTPEPGNEGGGIAPLSVVRDQPSAVVVDVEAEEDDTFARQYRAALQTMSADSYARILSGRLRQMDKRCRAANKRADAAEAEVKRLTDAVDGAYERAAKVVESRGPATQDWTSTAICEALDEAAAAIRNLKDATS